MVLTKNKDKRIEEINPIIVKLTEMKLTVQNPPIKELFCILKDYTNEGKRVEIYIPFLEINKIITGILEPEVGGHTWVKLQNYK